MSARSPSAAHTFFAISLYVKIFREAEGISAEIPGPRPAKCSLL
jgi:hypothetical protein